MPYVNPGAAAASSLEQFMVDKAATERQARLDAQNAQAAADRHAEAEAALARDKMEAALRTEDKQRAKVERQVSGMVPGDIPDSSTVAQARMLGVPLRLATDTKKDPVQVEQPSQVVQEMGGETPAPPAPEPAPLRFAGNPAQAKELEAKRAQEELSVKLKGVTNRQDAAQIALGSGVPYAQVDDVLNALMGPKATLPASAAEYEYAVKQGYKGSFEQYQNDDANRKKSIAGTGDSDTALSLGPSALDMTAKMYAKTGQLPPMGMGKAGAAARTKILERAAQYDAATDTFVANGGAVPDIASNKAGYTADSQALTALQKPAEAVSAFHSTVKKNSQLLREAIKDIPDSGIPFLNTPYRVGAQMLGDKAMSKFNAIRQSVSNEYARIISNPTLVGVLSDSARKEADALLAGNATPNQMLASLEILEQEASNRDNSYREQIQSIKDRISGKKTEVKPEGDTAKPKTKKKPEDYYKRGQ